MAVASDDYADDYEEYYEDEEGEGPSGLLILVVGILIVLVFSLIVVFAYKRGMADERARAGEVPLVTADAGPYKTERELDLPAAAPSEVEQRLSGEEPDSGQAQVLIEGDPQGDPLDDFEETASASAAASGSTATVPVRSQDLPDTNRSSASQSDAPVIQPRPKPEPPAASTSASTPATTAQSPGSSPSSRPSSAGGALSGTHLVQLGAVGSEAEAQQLFERLSDKYPSLVGGKSLDVQRADLGSRGVFYRLRIGPFASSSAANSHCSQLKGAGQDCLVRSVD